MSTPQVSKQDPSTVVATIAAGKLPKGFWNLEAFSKDDSLKEIHQAVVERLQVESPDADTLELMMMERVCFLYIFMRASEGQKTEDDQIKFDRTYKEMLALWVSMAADLRKQRLRAEETQGIRMQIVTEVARALKESLKDVDPAIANAVQLRLVSLVAV